MGSVVAVHASSTHSFSEQSSGQIELVTGIGVRGDAHAGETVKHRSRVRRDPNQPNLRQVHLIPGELFDELRSKGFNVQPGDVGENITTSGIDLPGLPRDAVLWIGETAAVRLTGLRNPCVQLDRFQPGLMKACIGLDAEGKQILKAGVMSVVLVDGLIRAGDEIRIELPPEPHFALERV